MAANQSPRIIPLDEGWNNEIKAKVRRLSCQRRLAAVGSTTVDIPFLLP
jgi:hypothetical protein